MRNIPALCAFLLCAALAAGTVGASLAAATMLKRTFTLDYDFSAFDPATATCADWEKIDLSHGPFAKAFILFQVAGYANALDGMPLPGMLEFIYHKRDHLQNICTAQPRKRLLTLWRDLRPLSLQAGRTTCANWLALSENGDFLQNLLYILWLYGYNQANNGAPGSLLSRLEGFEHDLQRPLGDICSRRPEILLRDAVQRMSSP